jgi:VIT1/CCC1 family predicted Fe2+/Mn2+ transporter
MALTFTGAIHAAGGDRDEIRALLVGAIGCNIAWGIVDAVMYLMTVVVTRSRAVRALRSLRGATEAQAAAILGDTLPDEITDRMEPKDFERLRAWLARVPEHHVRTMTLRDLRGALAVFLLVTLSTFPVVVPFLFVGDALLALRISNGVALIMLFGIGWMLGKYAGLRALLTGASMLGIGLVLVALTIALGG